jgi:hypothetical protein
MAASNFNATWTLTHQEYQELLQAQRELRALEAAGVDSWDGYSVAMRSLDEED